ncbi:MAG TPA: LuxR C-terminal-related transcriptional regulator [Streptosporangiaceae bacterium]
MSEREAEVLTALGARLTNAQIAGRLHISIRTVESHVSSLLRKYGVADRRALADVAAQVRVREAALVPLAGLPAVRTSFIGRTDEVNAVRMALNRARLVTLLGPGGVGKTRLAVAAASGFDGDGAFVDLVPVGDGFVARAVAAALGVTEGTHQPLEEAITARLAGLDGGRSLLVLDNCEHLIDEVARFVARVLDGCPGVIVLVTSRERLGVPGERTLPVAPLDLASAGPLFLDRARAADPEFGADPAVVAEVCIRLDGMPLAIELAAARSASLGATGLLTTLDDALRVLAGVRDTDERHRSLRAVIGWSHDLLDEEERALFRRLAVFAGPFDLAAAVAVTDASADVLGRLVEKSLVVHLRGEPSRWRLLETIRAYAAERLGAAGELADIRDRHLSWACDVAAWLESRLPGRSHDGSHHGSHDGSHHGSGGGWREDFDAVADDLRAALAEPAPGAEQHRLAHTLGHITYARRFLLEALDHYQRAAVLAPSAADAARDLRTAADCAHVSTTSNLQVFELLLASAERAAEAGDGNARAIALARAVQTAARFPEAFPAEVPADRRRKLYDEARAAGDPHDPVVAAQLAAAAVWNGFPAAADPLQAARATADPVIISAALHAASTAAVNTGRLRDGHRLTRERFALLAEMDRDDPYTATEICNTYGAACADAIVTGDLPTALATARQVLDDDLLGGHSYLSGSRVIPPLVLTGALAEALQYATQLWEGWQRSGRPAARWLSPALSAVALAYGLLGDRTSQQTWRSRAIEVAGTGTARVHLDAVAFVDARLALHIGDVATDTAAAIVERTMTQLSTTARTTTDIPAPAEPSMLGAMRYGRYAAYAWAAGAELAVAAGLPAAADHLAAVAAASDQNDWAAACLARATGRLHGDEDALAASIAGWERIDARFERACTLLLIPDRAGEGRAALEDLGIACDSRWWTTRP